MTDNTRDFQRYFEEGQRFCTPEELRELLRLQGSPKAMMERHAKLEALLDQEERREAVRKFLIRTGAAFIALVTILGALKALLPTGWPW